MVYVVSEKDFGFGFVQILGLLLIDADTDAGPTFEFWAFMPVYIVFPDHDHDQWSEGAEGTLWSLIATSSDILTHLQGPQK